MQCVFKILQISVNNL